MAQESDEGNKKVNAAILRGESASQMEESMENILLDCSRDWDVSLGNIITVESSKSIKEDDNGPLDSWKTNEDDNDVTKDGSGYNSFEKISLPSSDSEDSTDSISEESIPPQFICALTKQLMSDPVVLSSGQTVERRFIEAYFDIYPGCRKCPVTRKAVLSSHDLTPDDAGRAQIKRWLENKSINDERREYFRVLLSRLAHSGEDQVASAAELRALVKDFPAYAKVFYDIGPSAVRQFAMPLLSHEPATLESLREDLLVTFDLLVEHKKKIRGFFLHHPAVVDIIGRSLRSGSFETRKAALSLVYYIAGFPAGREILSETGVVEHLVELVEEDNMLRLSQVLTALFQFDERSQRVINGILTAILNHLENENLIRELGWLLTIIRKDTVVWEHVVEMEKIHAKLLDILKEHKSDAVKGFCVKFLLCIIQSNDHALLATRKCEDEYRIITRMFEGGDPQAKKIAVKVLRLLDENKPDNTAATDKDPLDFPLGRNECTGSFIIAKNGNGYKSFEKVYLPSSDSEDSTDPTSEELIPREFICALTKQPMSDPVVLSSGQRVERRFIEAYFHIYPGCRKCPVTKKAVLSSHDLIPDDALRARIKRWHENQTVDDERREYFRMLLSRLSHSTEDQLATVAELRELVNDFPVYAEVFYDIGPPAVLELATPLLSQEPATLESLHEDILETFDLLVEHKKEICEFFKHHPTVCDLICESIRSGSVKARLSALSIVYHIVHVPGGRQTLSERGVAEPLVKLVEEGDLRLLNDVLLVSFGFDEGSERVINGILTAFLNHLEDENQISNLRLPLAKVIGEKVVWEHFVESEKLYTKLLDILKEHKSDEVKNFCSGILLRIIRINHRALLATRKYEEEYKIITRMAEQRGSLSERIAVNVLKLLGAPKGDHTSATETTPHNELESADVMDTINKPDYTAVTVTEIHHDVMDANEPYNTAVTVTEMHHDELLDLLQEADCEEVMEVWAETLLCRVVESEAARIATWKRENTCKVISRVQMLGNFRAQNAAMKILNWLDTIDTDQV
ncbi:hypothetical protein QQ045_011106 [Rhodiola kirilowii]